MPRALISPQTYHSIHSRQNHSHVQPPFKSSNPPKPLPALFIKELEGYVNLLRELRQR